MMTAPSGEQYSIAAGDYAAVVTEAGATLRVLEYAGRPLVEPFAADEPCSRGHGQVLVPWPNRIRDGHWTHEGLELQLPLSEPGRHNASHGLVRWASWRPLEQRPESVTLGLRLLAQPGYPWTLDLALTYALSDEGLTVTLTATNLADSPAPFAAGFHPYLTAGSAVVDGDRVSLPARTRLLVDPERLLPTGTEPVAGTAYDFTAGRILGDLHLDDAFTDLDGHVVRLDGADGATELWADESFGWIQLFTYDDRAALAVEPMTAPPDAFNSGDGVVYLAPAERRSWRWGIRRG